MTKKISAISLIVIAVLPFDASARPRQYNGEVINASRDSIAMTGAEVHLVKMDRGGASVTEIDQTVTDDSGRFSFRTTDPDTAALYFAAADHQGLRFFSRNRPDRAMRIVVYDSTQDARDIKTLMHHIVIEGEPKTASLRETRIIQNPGRKALTNVFEEDPVGMATIKFPLPQNAIRFQPLSSRMSGELITHGSTVYDKGVYLPGNNQVSYGYQIPLSEKGTRIVLPLTGSTQSLELFINPLNITFSSDDFRDEGPFAIRGGTFQRYSAIELAGASSVSFTLQSVGGSGQSPHLTLGLTLFALALLTLAGYARSKKAAQGGTQTAGRNGKRRKDI